jgi:glycosyltransferase involved in cell wall biosynthesis
VVLHLIQPVPTPHNNVLIRAIDQRAQPLRLWYAMRRFDQLPWKSEVATKDERTRFAEGPIEVAVLLAAILFGRNDVFMFVGYSSPATFLGLCAAWLLGRRVLYWTDGTAPKVTSGPKAWLRNVVLLAARRSVATAFGVGEDARQLLLRQGFEARRVRNLPIFVDLPSASALAEAKSRVRQEFCLTGQTLIVSGSRLIRAKGFDLLVEAVGLMPAEDRAGLRVVLIGSGPEAGAIDHAIQAHGLEGVFRRIDWLEPGDFERLVRGADIYVHPARFDAFGGGSLVAMAAGVPVIGSLGAGTVRERVSDGTSGLVYDPENVRGLSDAILQLHRDAGLRARLGRGGRVVAEGWAPSIGADIIAAALSRIESTTT